MKEKGPVHLSDIQKPREPPKKWSLQENLQKNGEEVC
jgi:hypothetical protein